MKKIAFLILLVLLTINNAFAVHKGAKECLKGAVGERMLEQCVEAPSEEKSSPPSDVADEKAYDVEDVVKASSNVEVVPPERLVPVELSSSDVNRIVCPYEIQDVVFSQEKGVVVKIVGSNAFVKFLVKKDESKNELKYASVPTEFYVVCGENTYSMIAIPKRIPAKTIRLAVNKKKNIEKNQQMFKGMSIEEKVVKILKLAYKDDIPDSFTIKKVNRHLNLFKEIKINHIRTIIIEGEGLLLKEYRINAEMPVFLNEKLFLRKDLTKNTIALAVYPHNLVKGETARLFIIERHTGGEGSE